MKLIACLQRTYTLTITSANNPNCGSKDTVFDITFSPVFPSTNVASFCEGIGQVEAPQSTNYQWYDNDQNPIGAPLGNGQVIVDSNAFDGKNYYLFYELANGCGDTAVYVFADRKVDSKFLLSQPGDCRSLKTVFEDETPISDSVTYWISNPGYNNTVVDRIQIHCGLSLD